MTKTLSPSQEHGALWEREIRKMCRALKKAHRADVDKNWEAPKVRGSHEKREKSKPDFSGTRPGGRHIVFEGKATLSKTSIQLSAVSPGQWERLELQHEWGAISFVYVLTGERTHWVIPFRRWVEIEAEGERSSFSFVEESDAYRCGRGETWLDAWDRLEGEGLA